MTNRKNETNDETKQRNVDQPATDLKSQAKRGELDLNRRDLTNVDQSEAAKNDQANADQPGQTITQQIDAVTGEPVPTGRMQQDRNL